VNSNAAGAQKKAGATVYTTCGRQNSWVNKTGRLLMAKLARWTSLFKPLGYRGTHRGHLHTFTPDNFSHR
jgi:hypothetical protein